MSFAGSRRSWHGESGGSESPGERPPNSVSRHNLQSAIFDVHGNVETELRAQGGGPRKIELRTNIDNGFGRIVIGLAMEGILSFCFTGNQDLNGQCVVIVQNEIGSRADGPGQVVGITVAEAALS